jgi:hypothetical protein
LQFPGLILEPALFVLIAYWLAGLRSTLYAFLMTAMVTILTVNVSTACGKRGYCSQETRSNDSTCWNVTSWCALAVLTFQLPFASSAILASYPTNQPTNQQTNKQTNKQTN